MIPKKRRGTGWELGRKPIFADLLKSLLENELPTSICGFTKAKLEQKMFSTSSLQVNRQINVKKFTLIIT